MAKTPKKIYVICSDRFEPAPLSIDIVSLGYELTLVDATEPDLSVSSQPADEIVDTHFARAGSEGVCHAYITNPHLLTEELANECDRVFLDMREPCKLVAESTERIPKVSLITSMYKTDEFIAGFLKNCSGLNLYDHLCDHIFVVSDLSAQERDLLLQFSRRHVNIVIVWNRKDPGLYNCWKQGIELANTPYISNANVDDLRHSLHVSELVDYLDRNSHICLATTAIIPFYTYTEDVMQIDSTNPWFIDQTGEFNWWNLGSVEFSNGQHVLKPNNLPHSSPVWRKSLHKTYGFFDEDSFGTFADWAFWLKVFQSGECGYLSPNPYGYYYINLESHNRRGDRLDEYHRAIEDQFIQLFIERQNQNLSDPSPPPTWNIEPRRRKSCYSADEIKSLGNTETHSIGS